ncbi:MAG: hypothetical protein WCP97_00025 [bacterium]
MHKPSPQLKVLVEQIVKSTYLDSAEQSDDLRREMTSHFFEEERELLLLGHTQEEVISMVTQRFGSTDEVGKQLYMVQRRFEQVPFIGELFYYQPVLAAMKLFLLHCFIIAILLMLSMFGVTAGNLSNIPLFVKFFYFFSLDWIQLVFPLFGVFEGLWFGRKLLSRSFWLESCFISYTPFLLLSFMVGLNETLIGSDTNFSTVFYCAGMLVMHCVCFMLGVDYRLRYSRGGKTNA